MRDNETGGFMPNYPLTISELTDADKGRNVTFCHHHGTREHGVLSSWNDKYIFVRFGMGSTAAACDPKQLCWSNP